MTEIWTEGPAETWKPLEITPEGAGVEPTETGLARYLSELGDVEPLLTSAKALVLRGFDVGPDRLDPVLDALLPNRLPYVHGTSPRTKVGRNVYTSTEYPSEFTIAMHSELSYASGWPERLAFYCERPAAEGGATPVVDGALWLSLIDPEIRRAFAGGVRYIQNLHDGFGFGNSWQQTFECEDRDTVEELLRAAGAQWEWREGTGLRIEQTRPATARHPRTGEEVWFNQADQFHPAGLGDTAAAELALILGPDELPQSVFYADGGQIPAAAIQHIQQCGLAAAVDVEWRRGDILLIDNMLVAHGRRPYTGPRRVLVAMSG
ncbi:TauD/TfdA family dioxygenase [Actinospica durhamensis]|uniref:TauD/TfdA family dioxygenase n=1 Tax=Actinospica durhamensis TaxID=1508375 RepID=A0A941ISM1_9ACTN|nr:TauD/TfdA family dioxygenase [Actinospica durhamensis]MBR7835033.1 TauD/TfdA family dioxygenase [Actinospica durhamensis]